MGDSLWLAELTPDLDWQSAAGPSTRALAWNQSALELSSEGTHYVIAHAGTSTLERSKATYLLAAGMFGSVPGAFGVNGIASQGAGLVITHAGYNGFFQVGGPIEATGRLRYIDVCTDSLLLAPPVLGDPCLNHLHTSGNICRFN